MLYGIGITWSVVAVVLLVAVCGPGVRYRRWMDRIRNSGL